MPYTNIEARRKNQREWIAKKRARAKEQKQDEGKKCPGCGRELYDIYSGETKMCSQCGYEVKEGEQKREKEQSKCRLMML